MSGPKKHPPPPPVEDEDDEEDLDEMEEFGDEEEGVDLLDALGSWFTTEEGDTLATALVGIKSAVEMQNKILLKILSALNAKTPKEA